MHIHPLLYKINNSLYQDGSYCGCKYDIMRMKMKMLTVERDGARSLYMREKRISSTKFYLRDKI